MAHRMPIVAVASKKIAVGTTVASMSPGRPRRATAPRSRGVANAEAVSAGTFSVRGRNIHACGGFHVLCTLRPFARRPVLFIRREQTEMRADLARAVALGREWREASQAELADLGAAIERQFEAWSLTPAEPDIAGLMLKGVPLRDIAELRHTSDSTIRQQAQAIYRKSGLAGRAELAAYFLESLFEVPQAARPS
jgi:DNA-binding CsgD family transcriptional regulator